MAGPFGFLATIILGRKKKAAAQAIIGERWQVWIRPCVGTRNFKGRSPRTKHNTATASCNAPTEADEIADKWVEMVKVYAAKEAERGSVAGNFRATRQLQMLSRGIHMFCHCSPFKGKFQMSWLNSSCAYSDMEKSAAQMINDSWRIDRVRFGKPHGGRAEAMMS